MIHVIMSINKFEKLLNTLCFFKVIDSMIQKMHLRAVKSFNLVFRERFNLSQKFRQPSDRSLALFYFLFSNILIIFSY